MARTALLTIFKVNTKLRNAFVAGKVTVHKVAYPEEWDMLRSDRRGSTVYLKEKTYLET